MIFIFYTGASFKQFLWDIKLENYLLTQWCILIILIEINPHFFLVSK